MFINTFAAFIKNKNPFLCMYVKYR